MKKNDVDSFRFLQMQQSLYADEYIFIYEYRRPLEFCMSVFVY